MGRGTGNLRRLREQIAHQAARLIAEDGIQDFAVAKRKAARQLGVGELSMPNNSQVEQALRQYQAIYQNDEHAERLLRLRTIALSVMHFFAEFNPYLTGSVLTGTAARHAAIQIQLFTDSDKEVEIFLINQSIPFNRSERRMQVGEQVRPVPVVTFLFDDAPVEVTVLATDDLRRLPKTRMDGTPIERARPAQVEALVLAASKIA